MVLRQRKGKPLNRVVQDFDAFPKVPEPYVEQTASGASISIVTFLLVCWLIWSEAKYFMNPGFAFKFVPDADYEAKLSINIDVTIAMTCDMIGADILDSTNQNTFTFGRLKEEPTWFELDHLQRRHFDEVQRLNRYLREEYHAVQEILWQSGKNSFFADLPERRTQPTDPHDACRIHGTLRLNKVSGNFHVTAGKSVPLMRGHAHLTAFMGPQDYNFSHRIDKFSFGSGHTGIVHPLEGDEKISETNLMSYQYFIQVVPTDVQGVSGLTHSTYQYSVKDQARPIVHETGSHGVPGIYFKYDMSALKILVSQDREPIVQFLVRLCAGVGGLVATSQLLCGLLQAGIRVYCCGGGQLGVNGGLGGRQGVVSRTADLILPQERLERRADVKVEDAAALAQQKQGVTLQEVERLIKI